MKRNYFSNLGNAIRRFPWEKKQRKPQKLIKYLKEERGFRGKYFKTDEGNELKEKILM